MTETFVKPKKNFPIEKPRLQLSPYDFLLNSINNGSCYNITVSRLHTSLVNGRHSGFYAGDNGFVQKEGNAITSNRLAFEYILRSPNPTVRNGHFEFVRNGNGVSATFDNIFPLKDVVFTNPFPDMYYLTGWHPYTSGSGK